MKTDQSPDRQRRAAKKLARGRADVVRSRPTAARGGPVTSGLLRWADPEVAAAFFDLCELAPQLSSLIYCAPMPEKSLAVILDWSEAVVSPDCEAAFEFNLLRDVLSALLKALVSSHTYAWAERWDSGREVVELYDAGCGSIVGRVLPLTELIAVALHGEKGRAIVETFRAELAGTLARIHELMMHR